MLKTIVCYGDSNTHGYCSETNGRFAPDVRYPGVLKKELGSDYLIMEEGISGRTTAFDDPLFEGLNGLSYLYTCLMTHEPVNLLAIMLGTNDIKQRFHLNAENISLGLGRLIRKAMYAEEAFADNRPNILVITPPPILPEYESTFVKNEMGPGCYEKSLELSTYYAEVAGKYGCHYFDAGTVDGLSMDKRDCMHLTAESHELLGKALAEKIRNILQ